jgi:hypothetical protein
MIERTRKYLRRRTGAAHCRCEVCGGHGTMAIDLECSGPHGRKGSRYIGGFCEEHGIAKLAALVAKKELRAKV